MDITNKPKPVFPGPKPPAMPGIPASKPPTPSAKPLAPPPPVAKPARPVAVMPKALTPTKPVVQKPPIPTATPVTKPASPTPVTIHTMKDDLSSLRNPIRATNPAPAAKPLGSTPPSPATTAKTPSLPIAPLTPASGKSVVIPSGKPKRGLKGILTVAIVIIIAFLAAGAAAWYFMLGPSSSENPTAEAPKSLEEMIPATAAVVTEYQLNDASKQKIQMLFAQPSTTQPTFDTFLDGDPRLALQYADVSQLLYIQLPNNPRPYLLTPETDSLKVLFANTPASQTVVQNGWRVVHPINIGSFTSALSQASLSALPNSPFKQISTSYGLRVYLSAGTLASAIAQGAGISISNPGSFSATVHSDINISGGNLTLFDGIITAAQQPSSILKADPTLVALVPSDTQFVYAGKDVGADIQAWSEEPAVIAPEIVSQPQVKQILTELKGLPYVFYRQGSVVDGAPRFGLIIKLTPDLVRSLTTEKTGLETALFALRPLSTGSTAALPSLPLFADGTYNEIPLRYVNINGPAQAIDYAIADPYLIVATSKDGMFATLDVLAKKAPGLLEQNANLAPANASIQANSTAQSILIMSAQDSGILSQSLPGFVAAQNAIITVLAAALDGETQSVSGLLAF